MRGNLHATYRILNFRTRLVKSWSDPAKTQRGLTPALRGREAFCHNNSEPPPPLPWPVSKASFTQQTGEIGRVLHGTPLLGASAYLPLSPDRVENVEGIGPLPPARPDDCHPQDPHVRR